MVSRLSGSIRPLAVVGVVAALAVGMAPRASAQAMTSIETMPGTVDVVVVDRHTGAHAATGSQTSSPGSLETRVMVSTDQGTLTVPEAMATRSGPGTDGHGHGNTTFLRSHRPLRDPFRCGAAGRRDRDRDQPGAGAAVPRSGRYEQLRGTHRCCRGHADRRGHRRNPSFAGRRAHADRAAGLLVQPGQPDHDLPRGPGLQDCRLLGRAVQRRDPDLDHSAELGADRRPGGLRLVSDLRPGARRAWRQ